MPYQFKQFAAGLSYEEVEEQRLIETWIDLMNAEEESKLQGVKAQYLTKDQMSDRATKIKAVIGKLGYDPAQPRPSRQRGRPRDGAIPNPLPPLQTKLTSCLGEQYTIVAYGRSPRKLGETFDMVAYIDERGKLVFRNLVNLFCGMLPSGIPTVTWPEDPRGLKPGEKIPLSKRRTASKQDLKRDRDEMDEDLKQHKARKASGRMY
jgi:hypothetical protein